FRAQHAPRLARERPVGIVPDGRKSAACPPSRVRLPEPGARRDRAQCLRQTGVALLRVRLGAALCAALACAAQSQLMGAALGAESPGEYQVKAVFVFNFSRFVEWPPQAFRSATQPFAI